MPMNRIAFLLIFLICTSFKLTPGNKTYSERERWQQHASNTEIIRDDFGVPHIYGKTDADAVFGLLYAQCEDDFNRVEQNYIWATGRLAELEGENAIYSDLRAKIFMTQKEAEINYQNSPQWLKDLCLAFADGIIAIAGDFSFSFLSPHFFSFFSFNLFSSYFFKVMFCVKLDENSKSVWAKKCH